MTRTCYYNEIDAACCRVLRRHIELGTLNSGVVDERSIEHVEVSDVRQFQEAHFFAGIGGFALGFARTVIDTDATVWTGGFPCQDLSVAGRRAGLAGSRSGLYFQFHRLIAGVRPQFVVIENAPGLLSSNSGRDFAIVLAGLTGILCDVPADGWGNAGFARGSVYNVAWRVLDAQFFGVAQRRRRVFIVGSLGDGRSAEILFERESGGGHPQQGEAAGEGTAAATEGGAGWGGIAKTITSNYGKQPDNSDSSTPGNFIVTAPLADSGAGTARTGNARTEAEMLVSAYRMQRSDAYDPATVDATVAARDYKSATDLVAFQQNQREEVRSLGDVAGALAAEPGSHQQNYIAFNWYAGAKHGMSLNNDISPTLQVSDGTPPAVQQAAGVRRLTPLECERLQGFPDNWTAEQSDSTRYKQLGNAVCVNVAEWLGRRIVAVADTAAANEAA